MHPYEAGRIHGVRVYRLSPSPEGEVVSLSRTNANFSTEITARGVVRIIGWRDTVHVPSAMLQSCQYMVTRGTDGD